jgi:Ca2+-binding RTX toxin-like protein
MTTSAAVIGAASENQRVNLSARFMDPDAGDAHTVRIEWGDGAVTESAADPAAAGTINAGHAYRTGGVYTLKFTVTDRAGASAAQSTRAYVTGAGIHGGVLHVVGTAADDGVIVKPSGGQVAVSAAFIPGWHRILSAAAVTKVLIEGGGGNDRLSVYDTLPVPSVVDGGAGDDALSGGYSSLLIGGAGADRLTGAGGNDILVPCSTTLDGDVHALFAALSGIRILSATDLVDDAAADTLSGNRGRDVFFGRLSGTGVLDRISDYYRSADESVWDL